MSPCRVVGIQSKVVNVRRGLPPPRAGDGSTRMGAVPRRNYRLTYSMGYVKLKILNHQSSMLRITKHLDLTGVAVAVVYSRKLSRAATGHGARALYWGRNWGGFIESYIVENCQKNGVKTVENTQSSMWKTFFQGVYFRYKRRKSCFSSF